MDDDEDLLAFFDEAPLESNKPDDTLKQTQRTPTTPLPPVAPLPPLEPALPPHSQGRTVSSSSDAPPPSLGSSTFPTFPGRSKKADVVHLIQKKAAANENNPLRARSAYLFFTEKMLNDGYNGGVKSLGAKWRELSEEDRREFEDLAATDMTRHLEEVQKFYSEKKQDLMSVIIQCSTDSETRKRLAAPPVKRPREASDDALADLFDGADSCTHGTREEDCEVAAPQLRLDANGNIIVDAASLQATPQATGGVIVTHGAKPYEHAYKKTKRNPWTHDEDKRFWDALSVYGPDLLLIQTLFKDKTAHQIKTKYKLEEKRNRSKMDEHVYGVKRKKFSKDLFEEHFGQIDNSQHFAGTIDEKINIEPVEEEEVPPPREEEKTFDSLLDLFD